MGIVKNQLTFINKTNKELGDGEACYSLEQVYTLRKICYSQKEFDKTSCSQYLAECVDKDEKFVQDLIFKARVNQKAQVLKEQPEGTEEDQAVCNPVIYVEILYQSQENGELCKSQEFSIDELEKCIWGLGKLHQGNTTAKLLRDIKNGKL